MTEQEIAGLGPAFAAYLGHYRDCFLQKRTMAPVDTYCRGLLSDLPRKSVEPIALAAGTAVRTLQEFLVTGATRGRGLSSSGNGRPRSRRCPLKRWTRWASSTSCQQWGEHTPGVQRQYLGCVGKVDNVIVTVHIGVAKGRFQALLDADLYLPPSWDTTARAAVPPASRTTYATGPRGGSRWTS
jgi:SRSO17 transposase